jgi:hypothetical protein
MNIAASWTLQRHDTQVTLTITALRYRYRLTCRHGDHEWWRDERAEVCSLAALAEEEQGAYVERGYRLVGCEIPDPLVAAVLATRTPSCPPIAVAASLR